MLFSTTVSARRSSASNKPISKSSQPFSTRLALGFVERGMINKRHLRNATALQPGDPSLPREIRDYMCGERASFVWGGEG